MIWLSLPVLAFAYDLTPQWHHQKVGPNLEVGNSVQTHESIVNIGGSKFREIEYKGEKFFVRFLDKQDSLQDEVYCLKPGEMINDLHQEPYRVQGTVEISNRTSLFIEGLRVKCQKVVSPLDFKAALVRKNDNGSSTGLVLDPLNGQVGLSLQNKKKQGDTKVLVGPGGMGAGFDW